MVATEQIEIIGADRLAASFGRASRRMDDLSQSETEAATQLKTLAARNAPRRTGRLAASGRVQRNVVSFGNSNVDYAIPQNFGTGARNGMRGPHNVPATHFFTGAMARVVRDIPEIFEPEVQDILDDVKGA